MATDTMTKMQQIEQLLSQAGDLAAEIEEEGGAPVHVLLLTDDRNATVRGILVPTITAYQRPVA